MDLTSILSILLLDVFTTCRKVVTDFDTILITITISVLPDTPAIPCTLHLKHPSLSVLFMPLSAPLPKVYSSITFYITVTTLIGELVSQKLTASRHIFLFSPNA